MEIENLFKLYEKLGLNKKDFNDILKNSNNRKEQLSFSIGPSWYPGNRYGSICINDL